MLEIVFGAAEGGVLKRVFSNAEEICPSTSKKIGENRMNAHTVFVLDGALDIGEINHLWDAIIRKK